MHMLSRVLNICKRKQPKAEKLRFRFRDGKMICVFYPAGMDVSHLYQLIDNYKYKVNGPPPSLGTLGNMGLQGVIT